MTEEVSQMTLNQILKDSNYRLSLFKKDDIEDISRYFRDKVLVTAAVQYAA